MQFEYILIGNLFLWFHRWIVSTLTPVTSSFRHYSNILICCSKKINYYVENVLGYSRNPCSLNRERNAAWASCFGNASCMTDVWNPIESCQFIGWCRDAAPDALTSSAYIGERAIYSSDFSAEKNPVGSVRSLAANTASRSLFREQGLRE